MQHIFLPSVSVQMKNITETLMKPLERFRKEQLGTVRVMYDGSLSLPNLLCTSKFNILVNRVYC